MAPLSRPGAYGHADGVTQEVSRLPGFCVTFVRPPLSIMYPVLIIVFYWAVITALMTILWVYVVKTWKKVVRSPRR